MIVSVTPLGDSSGATSAVEVAGKIAGYLEGVGLSRGGRSPGQAVELPSLNAAGTVAYYADSTGIRPGRWLGARSGNVDQVELVALLAGVDPETGETLGSAGTSARGRRRLANSTVLRVDKEWYDTSEAAEPLGVKHTYLQRLAKSAADDLATERETGALPRRRGARAAAVVVTQAGAIAKDRAGNWRFRRDAIAKLAEARHPAKVVLAYDVTFSLPKDVSVIWARGDDDVRANVLSAIDYSVAAGISYLERHALQVRVGGEQQDAREWVGAEFLHLTSRALEPQLHKHVLVVNRAETGTGEVRALDGRLLFLHAKTAGYLAAAELRHQLTARLGVEHGKPFRGIASVTGVPRQVIDEFSTRSREISEAVEALGVDTAAARQVAAYDTRSAKEAGFDFDEVTRWWAARMDGLGFDEEALSGILNRVEGPRVLSDADRDEMYRRLLRVNGITETQARFDRRNVVQAIAEVAVERLSGEAIESLADRFLALDQVIKLETSRDTSTRDIIRLADGQAVTVGVGASYTTRSMLALEARAMTLYLDGRDAGAGVVPAEVLDHVLAEPRFSLPFSDEQRRFVTELTTSGQRIQTAVGRAGSGKTTALEAAVAAWQEAGYRVLGSAVGGTQSVLLAEEATGDARTVASVIARYFDYADTASIDDRTVLLVDEASLVSTKDVALLEQAVAEHPGAVLRLVGDQEQHSSVAAGGFFRWVVESHADEVPQLLTVYRQQGEDMAEVRLALDEYRAGMITEALERLERDGRIAEAETANEAYDLLACAWYAERQRRAEDPQRRVSSMTAEHHHERGELNLRARALLKADGTLAGPEVLVGGVGFQANDEVIARVGDRELRAEDSRRDQWVRNGSRGIVREVGTDHVVVDFEHWGRVTVPGSYIDQEVVPGVHGGLAHSYALTTYAVQGATMAGAMPLLTDASTREGTYVSLTRPQLDLTAIAIRYDRVVSGAEDELPTVRSEASDLEATARALERDRRERLASQADPMARRVNELAAAMPLDAIEAALDELHRENDPLLERVLYERLRLVGLRGVTDPAAEVVARLGPRPPERERRRSWDAAAGAIAIYRERQRPVSAAEGRVEWALGNPPEDSFAGEDYDRFAALIVAALEQLPEPASATAGDDLHGDSEAALGPVPPDDAPAEYEDSGYGADSWEDRAVGGVSDRTSDEQDAEFGATIAFGAGAAGPEIA